MNCCRCKRLIKEDEYRMTKRDGKQFSCCDSCYKIWKKEFRARFKSANPDNISKIWDEAFDGFLGKTKEIVQFT